MTELKLKVDKCGTVVAVNNTGIPFYESDLLMETQLLANKEGLDGALEHVVRFEQMCPNLRRAVDRALDFLTGVESRR